MSKILFKNDDLKVVESENHYVIVSDEIRCVYSEGCKSKRVCIKKKV